MKIVVCIKQVIDPESRLRLDPQTDAIDETIIGYVINPADLFALEEALWLRDMSGGGEVTLLAMGPPRCKRPLIDGLAMGADKAVHLWDQSFEGSDNYVTSMILAKAIDRIGYDMVLCGRQAIDDNGQQVPATIAGLLGLPFISAVTRIDIRLPEKKAITHRSLGKGDREIVECGLPAVFSVETGINRPRYAKARTRLQAEKKEIVTWGCDDLNLSQADVGQSGSLVEVRGITYPKPRAKKVATPPSDLPPHLRLQWLMRGGSDQGAAKNSSDFIEGSPEEVASMVLKYLTDEKILSAGDKRK
ncbi:MAG: electron transfer flavoprotein subunit beta/FixA family protein [Dehalococcoidia bacterium]|nr:electron transfer flavoprotein subunit beta/FixA family protein [Dehalococcoidia bacterium]